MQEGRGGYACFEGVVHAWVLLGCLLGCLCGGGGFVAKEFVCQEHGKWCLEERRKGVKEGRMQEGGADACEGVVHAGVLLGCLVLECPVGVPVCGGVLPKSLLFIEFF
ncbi:hypothetical protein [Bartonella sp. CM31XJBT]|uniref:hypothetical protein n=1 Tax=Bartonella sp. CM31XJBT TaxID=3019090 RepID=UPI00236116AD|nr:hypothetical protein [Bartonella sp. CM31XJBT]